MYNVCKIEYRTQGMGHHTGKLMNFINFAGCNLECPHCEVDHGSYSVMSGRTILKQLTGEKNVVLAGGEPTLHELIPLVKRLKEAGYWVMLETNGTNTITDTMRELLDYVSVAPKGFDHIKVKDADEVRVSSIFDYVACYAFSKLIRAERYYVVPIIRSGAFDANAIIILNHLKSDPERYGEWRLGVEARKIFHIR